MRRSRFFLSAVLLLTLSCGRNPVRQVNLFMGTAGDHGQVTPAASVPFGLVSVCPDSNPRQHQGYDYDVPEISGISITRMSGVGCKGVGGDLRLFPGRAGDTVRIVKESEKAFPGRYEARLDNGVAVELTATEDMALERYDLSGSACRTFRLDLASAFPTGPGDCAFAAEGSRSVAGWIQSPTACGRGGSYRLWFRLVADRDFSVTASDATTMEFTFGAEDGPVEIRIAVSPVDAAAATGAYDRWKDFTFNKLRRIAKRQWKSRLSRVSVRGGTKEERTIFYTSLYRVFLSPMALSAFDGRHVGTDGEVRPADGREYYGGWSIWDTFRTKFPLLTVLAPKEMGDIANSLAELYRTGKQDWSTASEPSPTVRTEHAVIVLLDAWRKGIRNFDLAEIYDLLREEAGIHFRQAEDTGRPDSKLEVSYDLWALSGIAEIVGRKEESVALRACSDSLFESTWNAEFRDITPAFAQLRNNGMYQGSRWQYRWAVPPYIDRMAEWVGRDTLAAQLNEFFDRKLFNMGNEPDIHTPFLFNVLGFPERTQAVVRAYLSDDAMVHLYGGNAEYPEPFVGRAFRNAPDGYAPEMDEDDGAMSAWYAFASMGFYPLVAGTDRYTVCSPVFRHIRIRSGRSSFVIRTRGRKSPDDPVRALFLDGRPLDGYEIAHADITSGKTLTLRY